MKKKINKLYYFEYKVILYFLFVFRCYCGEIFIEYVVIFYVYNNIDCFVFEGKWVFFYWYILYNLGGFYLIIK